MYVKASLISTYNSIKETFLLLFVMLAIGKEKYGMFY